MSFRRRVPLLAALLLAPPAALAGQTLELRLREAGSGAPVAGAIVRLLGERGVVAQALSNELGRVVLRAQDAGSYRVKIDRIGWSSIVTAPYTLGPGEALRQELSVQSQRTDLPALTVQGKSRCDAEARGGALATALWEEIRKALTANVLTQSSRAVPIHVREFVREVDPRDRFKREWVVASRLTRSQPFGALPPQALAQLGFVTTDQDSVTYAAPDAALLLSDEFVASHCFRAVPGVPPLVGLAFEPIAEREFIDVKGILWVDRASSELKYLEYGYVGIKGMLERADLGGRVELRRLPTGPWIVSYWHIRMPLLDSAEVRGTGGIRQFVGRLTGFRYGGGKAEVATDTLGVLDRALVIGRVFDSLTGGGLAGAVIRVSGVRDSVLSEADGHFSLAVQAAGPRLITASHPHLRVLGEAAQQPALLSVGDSVAVEFAGPSLSRVVRRVCGAGARNRSGLAGLKLAADGRPADYLDVRISWRTTSGGTREERSRGESGGLYVFCDLPPDRPLPVRLLEAVHPLLEQSVRLEYGRFSWLDLRVPTQAPRP